MDESHKGNREKKGIYNTVPLLYYKTSENNLLFAKCMGR